ncbi:hypothetical protein J2X47_003503 [Sphingomonas sp. BE270]|jgi:hypothetical protein|uniref:hypothetical protein n=1 Tax=Sphingomonas sp. BE270 TaxID=2817726 RepID=UPI00285C14B8|nr:hypothetical protein [Sphingomonas sp. BE270]MDR7259304.1 hypothetical protein [Sphingomonas sp. BE270]
MQVDLQHLPVHHRFNGFETRGCKPPLIVIRYIEKPVRNSVLLALAMNRAIVLSALSVAAIQGLCSVVTNEIPKSGRAFVLRNARPYGTISRR